MSIPHFKNSSIGGHLGCFHFVASMNNAATNIHVQVSVWIHVSISLGYLPRSGLAGSRANSMFSFWAGFSKMLHHFPSPPVRYESSNFSTSLPTLVVRLSDYSHPRR